MPGFADEIKSGDRIRALAAMRDVLTAGIETKPSYRARAGLYLALERVLSKIDEAENEETPMKPAPLKRVWLEYD